MKKQNFDLRKRDTVERENQVLKKQVDECKIVLGTIITASRRVSAIYSQSGLLKTFDILVHLLCSEVRPEFGKLCEVR